MARFTPLHAINTSGWVLLVGAEYPADVDEFVDQEHMEVIRREAPGKMRRAVNHIVAAIQKTLSKQYPLIGRAAGSMFTTAWGTRRRFGGRERRQPSPPGTPPGRITGDLRASWRPGRMSWSHERTVLTGRYESRHPAAGRHERGDPGTRTGMPLPARPYQRPTLMREADTISRLLDGTD